MNDLNIYQKLKKMRSELYTKNIKKTATNAFAKYDYLTLDVLIPEVDELCNKFNVLIINNFTELEVTTKLINLDNTEEEIVFTSYVDLKVPTGQIKGTQAIGSNHTYMRRYMLMLIFEIIESDEIETNAGKHEKKELTELEKLQIEVKKIVTEKYPDSVKEAFQSLGITAQSNEEQLKEAINKIKEKI